MCDAKIRMFRPINDVEVECRLTFEPHRMHQAMLKDYAYPGSETVIDWTEDDRRTFHGEWPGQCGHSPACNLPNGHHGRCNVD